MWNPPTAKQLQKIPDLYSQEDVKDKKIYMKFFLGQWTWYIAEINHKTTGRGDPPYTIMFGLTVNERTGDKEWGYISLPELRQARQGFVHVDREVHGVTVYRPKRLSQIR